MTLPFRVCEQPREMSSLASSLSKCQTHLGNIGASSTRCNVRQLLKLLVGKIVQENLGTSNRFSGHVHKKNHIEAIHEQSALKTPKKKTSQTQNIFAATTCERFKPTSVPMTFPTRSWKSQKSRTVVFVRNQKKKNSFHDKTYFSGAPLRQQPVIEYPRIDNYISSDNWKSQKTRTLVLVSEAKNCSSSMEK